MFSLKNEEGETINNCFVFQSNTGGEFVAIEKMYMVNLVGHLEDFDNLTKVLAQGSFMQPVNALQEIDSSDFVMKTSEDNVEALMDAGYIRPYIYDRDYTTGLKKINKLIEEEKSFKVLGLKTKDVILDFDEMEQKMKEISEGYDKVAGEYETLSEKLDFINKTQEVISFLQEVNSPIENLRNIKNFKVSVFKVGNESMDKIKANYENIPSVIETVYKDKDITIFMAFTPILLLSETERIFKSANAEELVIPDQYRGLPKDVLDILKTEKADLINRMSRCEGSIKAFLKENNKTIKTLRNSYELEQKSSEIKKSSASTLEFFYLSGWVPQCYIEKLEKIVKENDRIMMIKKEPHEVNNKTIVPPTKLKNSKIFSPFESMVGMYGIPTYNEIDPTLFLAITYTLMFGAMFGDVGQGGVLFLMGYFLRHNKKRVNLGGILERLGLSSVVFGFLYGSIFGSEEIIGAILIRPMEDIKDVLIWAIIFGCGFLLIGFILGITNCLRRGDIEHGVFGKEGLAGFLFYIGALTLVVTKLRGKDILPGWVWTIYLIFFLVLILLKQPLANLIKGKRPLFDEGAKDYFIESSFEVIETVLSLFSNTVSFIRVGAFALNHVGLFVAFSAMAHMANSGFASVFILILGNIIIIGLEGLIVFIQGLRLQYYELFSKYYQGAGVPFEPVEVNFNA